MTVAVEKSTVLVTGANQGIGRGFVEALLQRDVQRVYATARQLETLEPVVAKDPNRVVPLSLDVTNAEHRRAAAAFATDVNILINNAGISGAKKSTERRFLAADSLDDCRQVLETNFYAPAEMCRAFAPAIVRNGSGAIINILSMGALFCSPETATYCVSKAAASIMTQGIRHELHPNGVFVAAVYTGGVDTRMTAGFDVPTISPLEHAQRVLDDVEAGVDEIFPSDDSRTVRDMLRHNPKELERMNRERFYSGKAYPAQ